MKRTHIQDLLGRMVYLPTFILCLAAMGARADEWPMFQFDARHSANNTEDFVRLPLGSSWKYESGADSFGFSSAIQSHDAIYASFSNGKLSAFNKRSGAPLWTLKVDGVVHSAPAYHNDIVYFASSEGKIYALGASDGKVVWVYSAGTAINTSPVIKDNLLFLASNNGIVYALKINNGELVWKTDLGNEYVRSSPAADQSSVYAATLNGNVFALDKFSGALLWDVNIQGQISAAPSVDGSGIYIGANDGKLRALRTQDGAVNWTYNLGYPVSMALAVSTGAIHAVSRDGQVHTLAKSDGGLLWKFKMDAPSYSAPTIVGETLLTGANDKNLYAFRVSDGSLVSKMPLDARVLSPVSLSRGKAVFLGNDGTLNLLKSPNRPPLQPSDLKVNGLSNPVINSSAPIFMWNFRDSDQDDKQGGYVLQLAGANSDFVSPVFDSGMVQSTNSAFALSSLLPEGKYFWRVITSDLFDDLGVYTAGDDFFVWDRTAPQVSHALAPLPNAVGWNNAPVNVMFSGTDSLSGIAGCLSKTVSTEGRAQLVAGWCRDLAGNLAAK